MGTQHQIQSFILLYQDQTKQALKTYQPVLTKLIQSHAHMRRPVAIKYIEDRDGEELESIFEQLSQQEK